MRRLIGRVREIGPVWAKDIRGLVGEQILDWGLCLDSPVSRDRKFNVDSADKISKDGSDNGC